jgi:hypothetical protein
MNVSLTTRFKGQSSDSQDGSEFMTADECEFNTFRSVQDWRETIGSKALSVSFEFNNHQCFEKNVYKYIDIFFKLYPFFEKKCL